MKFELSGKEMEEFCKWRQKHDKKCKLSPQNNRGSLSNPCGAIGGRFTYKFTPTGLGICVAVECACGGKADLTDCSDW